MIVIRQAWLLFHNLSSMCPPPSSTHTCSESFCKVFMSLLMGSRGKSSHINFNATFNSLIVFGFGHRLWYFSSIAPLSDNPFVGVRTDFGVSLPLRRSRADPLSSMRWHIFNGRLGLLSFHCLSGQVVIRALLKDPAHEVSAYAFCLSLTPCPFW